MIKIAKRFISLFSGIGGFDLALERNGWECVGYSEIDKYAIQTYNRHFKSQALGDITEIDTGKLPDFDLLCGGFPCQAFSIAGKRRGFEDTRGTLFFEIARILRDKRPSYFIFENVKGLLNHNMGQTFKVIIQALDELGYEFQWMVLNSKFHGVAQNRERVFFIGNIRGKSRLKILPFREDDELSVELQQESSDVFGAILASSHKGISKNRSNVIIEEKKLMQLDETRGNYQGNRVYSPEGVSQTLSSSTGGKGGKTGLYMIPQVVDIYEKEILFEQTRRVYDANSLSPTLNASVEPTIMIGDFRTEEGLRVRVDNNSPTLTSHGNTQGGVTVPYLIANTSIRKLTPLECERLQGFPDGWTLGVSDSQRYKQLGNAVTVNVVETIIKRFQS